MQGQTAEALKLELSTAFDRFIRAQNAHDLDDMAGQILPESRFLWITMTRVLRGFEPAMENLARVYQGVYQLEPRLDDLRFPYVTPRAAQLYVPVDLTIGRNEQDCERLPFMLHQSFERTADGWKIAAILPVRGKDAA